MGLSFLLLQHAYLEGKSSKMHFVGVMGGHVYRLNHHPSFVIFKLHYCF